MSKDKTRSLVSETYVAPNRTRVGVSLPEHLDIAIDEIDKYLTVLGVQAGGAYGSIVCWGVVNPQAINETVDMTILYDTDFEFDRNEATWVYRVVSGNISDPTVYHTYTATYDSTYNKVIPDSFTCSLLSAEMNGTWTLVVDNGEESVTDPDCTMVQSALSCAFTAESPLNEMSLTGTITDSLWVGRRVSTEITLVFTGTINSLGTSITAGTFSLVGEGEDPMVGTFTLTKNTE